MRGVAAGRGALQPLPLGHHLHEEMGHRGIVGISEGHVGGQGRAAIGRGCRPGREAGLVEAEDLVIDIQHVAQYPLRPGTMDGGVRAGRALVIQPLLIGSAEGALEVGVVLLQPLGKDIP